MQIIEYNATEAALTTLSAQYSGVTYEVNTTAGMSEAKVARAMIKGYRTSLEKMRVELKAPALERSRLIDAEAKRITVELVKLEAPIDEQIKAEESRKEQERVARAEANRLRIANNIGKIEQIKAVPANVAAMTSAEVSNVIVRLENLAVGDAEYEEFLPMAHDAKVVALQQLSDILAEKLAQEADAERIEGERLAEEARAEAERHERDRLAQIESVRLAAEQKKLDDERAIFEEEKAEVARKQVENDRIAREAKGKEQAEIDRKATEVKKEQDAIAAEQQEKDRIAAVTAKEEREKAEAKAAEEEKARKLAEVRYDSALTALEEILEVCADNKLSECEALVKIALIAEANCAS